MKRTHRLYIETKKRVGAQNFRGIDRLIDQGLFGIAERHAVEKLFEYVKEVEGKAGVAVPEGRAITINHGTASYHTFLTA